MLRFTVGVRFTEPETADDWIAWLNGGHIANVIAGGATSAEIFQLDGADLEYEVVYRFPSREAFADYERDHAPKLRAEGLARFPPERVRYRRGTAVVVG